MSVYPSELYRYLLPLSGWIYLSDERGHQTTVSASSKMLHPVSPIEVARAAIYDMELPDIDVSDGS